jgi:hypothetical protein
MAPALGGLGLICAGSIWRKNAAGATGDVRLQAHHIRFACAVLFCSLSEFATDQIDIRGASTNHRSRHCHPESTDSASQSYNRHKCFAPELSTECVAPPISGEVPPVRCVSGACASRGQYEVAGAHRSGWWCGGLAGPGASAAIKMHPGLRCILGLKVAVRNVPNFFALREGAQQDGQVI